MAEETPDGQYPPPPHQMATWAVLGAAFVLVLGLFSIRCAHGPGTSRAYASRALPPEPAPVLMDHEMNDEYWPCSDCHADQETNPVPRELEEDHVDHVLAHGDLWCLNCHDAGDRDQLHRSDGSLVAFEDSWRLCTQCHGNKLAEWKAGVHGKRTGHWWGAKEYRTCVECHNPHTPKFAPLEPLPAPLRPTEISRSEAAPVKQEAADGAR